MHRNYIPLLRTLVAAAVTTVVVACAEHSGPTSLAELGADAGIRGDSAAAECDLTVSGTVWRYSGVGDSASDTLGRLLPLAGARIELYLLAPLPPRDTTDTIPNDTIPNDTIPNDTTTPPDSSGGWDTLWVRNALALRAPSVADTSGGVGGGIDTTRGPSAQPDARGTSRGDGTYAIDGVCPGLYLVRVHEPGTGRSISTVVVIRSDLPFLNFAFPPNR